MARPFYPQSSNLLGMRTHIQRLCFSIGECSWLIIRLIIVRCMCNGKIVNFNVLLILKEVNAIFEIIWCVKI